MSLAICTFFFKKKNKGNNIHCAIDIKGQFVSPTLPFWSSMNSLWKYTVTLWLGEGLKTMVREPCVVIGGIWLLEHKAESGHQVASGHLKIRQRMELCFFGFKSSCFTQYITWPDMSPEIVAIGNSYFLYLYHLFFSQLCYPSLIFSWIGPEKVPDGQIPSGDTLYIPQVGGEIAHFHQQWLHFPQWAPSFGMGKTEPKMDFFVLILKNSLMRSFCWVLLFPCFCFSAVLIYNEKLPGVIFHRGCH